MDDIVKRLKHKVEFFTVYIKEAHPVDGWHMPVNDRAGIIFNQPKSLQEREKIAQACSGKLEISMPVLVDKMNDKVAKDYAAFPDRLYVIDKEGKVAYKSGRGPFGYKPREMEQQVIMLLLEDVLKQRKSDVKENDEKSPAKPK